ncbi:MAG: IS3 family transposase [Saprospiraceae bacterium]
MDHASEFPVKKMSEVLDVSRSGYYRWKKSRGSNTADQESLNEEIKIVFEDSRQTYGSPRVQIELQKKDIAVSASTVARRMRSMKITPKKKKRFKVTTDSKHGLQISPNLLKRDFAVTELGKVWVSDITYIRVRYSFVYLTTVIDLADRMVVGWSLSDTMTDEDTVIAAFKKAIKNRKIKPGLMFHSDRGSQYASTEFRKLLTAQKCVQSMSRKGNCWDNAVAESFFKTIKSESLNRYKFENSAEVFSAIFDYIDGWYNTRRIHSTLGGKSPREMAGFLAAENAA